VKKSDVVHFILKERLQNLPQNSSVTAFAPTNIALCKYWGKRDPELNLPMTSSLSISLGNKGATTELSISQQVQDNIILNGETIALSSNFGKRLIAFLDLFRTQLLFHFQITIQMNIPVAAGLASSACGFASLVLALNKLFDWQLTASHLSILARLGSGSACRSIWPGFVEWNKGDDIDGMDSHGHLISETWPELCIGLLLVNKKEKKISSREAMQRTMDTSLFYSLWPQKVNQDLITIKKSIQEKDFLSLGKTAESNALTMHAMMLSAWPPINYCLPETVLAMQKIWELRQQGLALYFTQDAGPNLKLLFLSTDMEGIKFHFPMTETINSLFPVT
jgi:diphosphomevalonate decarboxylase